MATIHFIEPRVADSSTTSPTDRGEHNILGRSWMQLSLAILLLFNRVTMRAAQLRSSTAESTRTVS